MSIFLQTFFSFFFLWKDVMVPRSPLGGSADLGKGRELQLSLPLKCPFVLSSSDVISEPHTVCMKWMLSSDIGCLFAQAQ